MWCLKGSSLSCSMIIYITMMKVFACLKPDLTDVQKLAASV